MKICVFTSTYPDKGSYQGIFVKNHCDVLSNDHDVSILYSKGIKPTFPLKNSPKRFLVEKTFDGKNQLFINKSIRLFASFFVNITKKEIIRSFKALFEAYVKDNGLPDLIICHFSYPTGIAALMIAKEHAIPFICIEHLSLLLKNCFLRNGMYREIGNVLLNSDAIVCVSEALRNKIAERYRIKEINVIANPIDDVFKYRPLTKNVFEPYKFISVGNLVSIKRFDLLIKAFKNAFSDTSNVVLNIVGTGKKKKSIQRLIKKNKLEAKVFLLGQMNHSQLAELYSEADCFVLLSKHETFGLVYREALICGCPVISSDNGGINYGWNDIFGKKIKTDSIQEISSILKMFFEKKIRFDRKQISDIALSSFSNVVFERKMNAIINNTIEQKRGH